MAKKITDNNAYAIIFLTLVTLASVSLLSAIDSKARPQIIAQQQAKIRQLLGDIFPEMQEFTQEDGIYTITGGNDLIGYAFLGKGKGYGGDIKILVGIGNLFKIKDVVVISHTETPGLGDKIIKQESFAAQFVGMNASDVKLKKDGGKVDAITGATISSKAVTDGVRAMMEDKIAIINGRRG